MTTQPLHPPINAPRESLGYDTSRIHTTGMFYFLLFFILTLALLILAVWLMLKALTADPRPQDVSIPINTPALDQPLQPSPIHKSLDWQDLATLRASQQTQLTTEGPLPNDPQHHHIPIDAAMTQLLRTGTLTKPWATTMPYQRPANEPQSAPSVENRT